jgi:hypothetical protein
MVGKEEDVMSNSAVARGALPPSLVPNRDWRGAMDDRIWTYYTTGEHARKYDRRSTTHLLRFLRNVEAHPPPQNSAAQAVLAAHGGMASYFTFVYFPEFVLRVRNVLAADESWRTRSGLCSYLHRASSHLQPPLALAPRTLAHSSSLLPAPVVGELERWLVSIHPAFATYAAALTDYGYEDLGFLQEVETAEFEEALTKVGMTKPAHRALALRRFQQLADEMN